MLELDCQLTADCQVIVSHDNKLSRTAGWLVDISSLPFSELPEMLHELEITFEPGRVCFSDDRKFPLLRSVFEKFPKMPINVDIKVDNDILISKVSELIKEFNREHITVWGNRDNKITEKCYNANPIVPLLFSLRKVLLVLLLFYTGLLPFVPIKEQYFEIPYPGALSKFFSKHGKGMWAIKLMHVLLMRRTLFKHLQSRGIQVYLWVLNCEDEFDIAFNTYKVDGVMTDYPTRLTEYLRSKPVNL